MPPRRKHPDPTPEPPTPNPRAAVAAFRASTPSTKYSSAPERLPLLYFRDAGWCSELGKSYPRGPYRPATETEYRALEAYAEKQS